MNVRIPFRPPRMKGFTLIELMVSITLGLLIIAALGSVFVAGNRSYRQDERLARMNDETRFGTAQLTRDLEMAGYWTQLFDPANVTLHNSLAIDNDCGPVPVTPGTAFPGLPARTVAYWTYDNLSPVEMMDNTANPSGADAHAAFPCIAADEFQPGTDIIAIKRVAGNNTSTLDDNHVYLRTNGTENTLFQQTSATPPDITGSTDWEYVPSIYFIRNYTVADESGNPVDSIPSLCRKHLEPNSGTPRWKSDCFAQGIENMQLEYGIDSNADGSPDFYVAAPDPTQLAQAVTVRVLLLARSVEPVPQYVNDKTYRLSNAADYSPHDRFYRRLMTTVVVLRNPANLAALAAPPPPPPPPAP